MKLISTLLAVLTFSLAMAADTGPHVPPCEECPEYQRDDPSEFPMRPLKYGPPLPQGGFWYDPEQPGTGFNVDVQNGIIAAAYYGYDDEGNTLWYLFNGPLERSEVEHVYWELDTPLLRYSNGQTIDGDYVEPSEEEDGTIRLEVLQRNVMRYRVDDGPWHTVVPLLFGTGANAHFAGQSDYRLPNLERHRPGGVGTLWVLVERHRTEQFSPWEYGYAHFYFHWVNSGVRQSSEGNTRYYWTMWKYDAPPNIHDSGLIYCGSAAELSSWARSLDSDQPEMTDEAPICIVRLHGVEAGPDRFYYMPLGNLGDRRFTAVASDGRIVEGFRLIYD